MLTDKAELYRSSPLVEAARRTLPVLTTRPGQVYDVDPSVSDHISMVPAELSGSGPRPFDASSSTTTGLFMLEVSKSWENWMVLGRLDERDKVLPFSDLGLEKGTEYLVFEFWTKQFLGSFKDQLQPPDIDTSYRCQVLCFRKKLEHPQLLATNRHISCGAAEITDLIWKENSLSGTSTLVPGEDYMLYVHEPATTAAPAIDPGDGFSAITSKSGDMRTVIIHSSGKKTCSWKLTYPKS
jgi:hypothetical protein